MHEYTKEDNLIILKNNIEDIKIRFERFEDKITKRVDDIDNKRSRDTKEIKTEISNIKNQTEVQEIKIGNIAEKFESLQKSFEKGIKKIEETISKNVELTKKENNKILGWIISAMGIVIVTLIVYIATNGKVGG